MEKLSYLHIEHRFTDYLYVCDAFEIKVSSCKKDPGVIFNNSITFISHYEVICKKANIFCSLIFKSFENKKPYIPYFSL